MRDRQILAAAADLFYERGYAATSLAAIGERVGVTGPAIYSHFASKEEILRTLVLESAARLEDVPVEPLAEPRAELARMARHHVNLTLTHRRLVAVCRREAKVLPSGLRQQIEARRSAYLDRWIGLLGRCWPDRDRDDLATTATAALGIVDSQALWPDDVAFDTSVATERFTEMVLAGLGIPGEGARTST